ncbi:hypothetical protein PRIPAC_89715 [Pristionchus pacificus]|uniref:Uncharacterized protein n=1 Tax=Pristionchus pacificus TaxID=54126 RepID=A0A2A6B6U4_PRIPA|nr:hypothetical protein PRIPAC_89715 [Pristionchus pacificus]|eukprot:PDM61573.1 hypothetical protein PRIPAC_51015 [Pristionchus pacificus]
MCPVRENLRKLENEDCRRSLLVAVALLSAALLLCGAADVHVQGGRHERAARVHGLIQGRPVANVTVELREWEKFPPHGALVSSMRTGADGRYRVAGGKEKKPCDDGDVNVLTAAAWKVDDTCVNGNPRYQYPKTPGK